MSLLYTGTKMRALQQRAMLQLAWQCSTHIASLVAPTCVHMRLVCHRPHRSRCQEKCAAGAIVAAEPWLLAGSCWACWMCICMLPFGCSRGSLHSSVGYVMQPKACLMHLHARVWTASIHVQRYGGPYTCLPAPHASIHAPRSWHYGRNKNPTWSVLELKQCMNQGLRDWLYHCQ